MDAQLHHALSAVSHAPLPQSPTKEQAETLLARASALEGALDALEAVLARAEDQDER